MIFVMVIVALLNLDLILSVYVLKCHLQLDMSI